MRIEFLYLGYDIIIMLVANTECLLSVLFSQCTTFGLIGLIITTSIVKVIIATRDATN